jgi:hypothetical protein
MKYIKLFENDSEELDKKIKRFEITEQELRSCLENNDDFEFLNEKELKFLSKYIDIDDLEYSGGKYGGSETLYYDNDEEEYYFMPITKIIFQDYFDINIFKKDDYYIIIYYDQSYSSTFYNYFKLDQLNEFKYFMNFYLRKNPENEYINEQKTYYNENDIVLIHYWYNDMICPVKIIKKIGRKYEVSHNNEYSKIQNAPNETINSTEIIDLYRKKLTR